MSEQKKSNPRDSQVIRCSVCNEDYSVTYKRCPFCNEPPRAGRVRAPQSASSGSSGGRRSAGSTTRRRSAQSSANPIHIVGLVLSLILLFAAFFIVFRACAPLFTGDPKPPPASSQGGTSQPPAASSQPDPTPPATGEVTGLTLNTSELTVAAGATATLQVQVEVTGDAPEVVWESSDESVVTVTGSGFEATLTNVNTTPETRAATIVVTCGGKTAKCVVSCAGSGTTPTTPGSSTGKTGPAKVTGASSGVFVRSGPGRENEAIATLFTGNDVVVVRETDGWYEITFQGPGGATVSGYISADYVTVS